MRKLFDRKNEERNSYPHVFETSEQLEQIEELMKGISKTYTKYSQQAEVFNSFNEAIFQTLSSTSEILKEDFPQNDVNWLTSSLELSANFTNFIQDSFGRYLSNVTLNVLEPLKELQANEIKSSKAQRAQYSKARSEMESAISELAATKGTKKTSLEELVASKTGQHDTVGAATVENNRATIKVAELSLIGSMCHYFDHQLEYLRNTSQYLTQLLPKFYELKGYAEAQKAQMQREGLKRKESILMAGIQARRVEKAKLKVFGISLMELAKREQQEIPQIIPACINFLRSANAHEIVGIFRVSATKSLVDGARERIDNCGKVDFHDLDPTDTDNAHVVACLLKLWLRSLPSPLIPYSYYKKFIDVNSIQDKKARIEMTLSLLDSLPKVHRLSLGVIMHYLTVICEHASVSKMSSGNLATCMGPTILASREFHTEETNLNMLELLSHQNTTIAFMIEHTKELFVLPEELLNQLEQDEQKPEQILKISHEDDNDEEEAPRSLTVTFPGYSSSTVVWEGSKTLSQILTKLFKKRALVMDNYVVLDKNMRVLNLDKLLKDTDVDAIIVVEKNSSPEAESIISPRGASGSVSSGTNAGGQLAVPGERKKFKERLKSQKRWKTTLTAEMPKKDKSDKKHQRSFTSENPNDRAVSFDGTENLNLVVNTGSVTSTSGKENATVGATVSSDVPVSGLSASAATTTKTNMKDSNMSSKSSPMLGTTVQPQQAQQQQQDKQQETDTDDATKAKRRGSSKKTFNNPLKILPTSVAAQQAQQQQTTEQEYEDGNNKGKKRNSSKRSPRKVSTNANPAKKPDIPTQGSASGANTVNLASSHPSPTASTAELPDSKYPLSARGNAPVPPPRGSSGSVSGPSSPRAINSNNNNNTNNNNNNNAADNSPPNSPPVPKRAVARSLTNSPASSTSASSSSASNNTSPASLLPLNTSNPNTLPPNATVTITTTTTATTRNLQGTQFQRTLETVLRTRQQTAVGGSVSNNQPPSS